MITRRVFTLSLASLPLVACGPPKTPLAHLYGQGWVHGAYELYGKSYHDLQTDSEQQSFDAYRVIAQRGVTALDGLQAREVPFHIHVTDAEQGFVLERDVPDVLTFRADMNEAQRAEAQAAWEKAREHIHTDYVEIQGLEWSLTRLLNQMKRVRAAIENTREEQFKLVRQHGEVGAGTLPFELPYEVKPSDYQEVLILLIDRLESDRGRLEAIESAIAAVGLTVRATDAGSASLAQNVRKVLLAVIQDASEPRPITFPTGAERDKALAHGKELMAKIEASAEYKAFLTRSRDKALEQIGSLLSVLDRFTGLPTSRVYRLVVDVWKGNQDYLGYLKNVAGLIPVAGPLTKTIEDGIALTEKVRKTVETVNQKGIAGVKDALVNTGTKYAKEQIGKQLAFFKDAAEAKSVESALLDTALMKMPIPKIPVPGLED